MRRPSLVPIRVSNVTVLSGRGGRVAARFIANSVPSGDWVSPFELMPITQEDAFTQGFVLGLAAAVRERRGAEGRGGDISSGADQGGRRNLCERLCDLPRQPDGESAVGARSGDCLPKKRSPGVLFKSVTNGKNNMPPWGDVLKPNDIEALWAYF